MEIKLNPCPFCGSKAELDDREVYEAVQEKYGKACLDVSCENPDCAAAIIVYNRTNGPLPYEVMAEKAAEKWNRRE